MPNNNPTPCSRRTVTRQVSGRWPPDAAHQQTLVLTFSKMRATRREQTADDKQSIRLVSHRVALSAGTSSAFICSTQFRRLCRTDKSFISFATTRITIRHSATSFNSNEIFVSTLTVSENFHTRRPTGRLQLSIADHHHYVAITSARVSQPCRCTTIRRCTWFPPFFFSNFKSTR